jgi:hypothetical protein
MEPENEEIVPHEEAMKLMTLGVLVYPEELEKKDAEIARLNIVFQQAQQLCGMQISGNQVFVYPSTEGNWIVAPELFAHIDQLTKQSLGK